jgi:general secretion pathway protein H
MISRRDAAPASAGFTLIELVVVLAIVGMALAMAVPLVGKRLPGAALAVATTEIRDALRSARSTAIAQDRPVVFRGDAGGGYWLDRRHYALGDTRVTTEGGTRIAFFPSGGASGGRIVLTSTAGRHEIVVDAVTGRADVRQ